MKEAIEIALEALKYFKKDAFVEELDVIINK